MRHAKGLNILKTLTLWVSVFAVTPAVSDPIPESCWPVLVNLKTNQSLDIVEAGYCMGYINAIRHQAEKDGTICIPPHQVESGGWLFEYASAALDSKPDQTQSIGNETLENADTLKHTISKMSEQMTRQSEAFLSASRELSKADRRLAELRGISSNTKLGRSERRSASREYDQLNEEAYLIQKRRDNAARDLQQTSDVIETARSTLTVASTVDRQLTYLNGVNALVQSPDQRMDVRRSLETLFPCD